MSYFDFNQNSTSATDHGFGCSASRPRQVWSIPPKHCGGQSKCGNYCHQGINCTIVDKYEKDGKTVYKYYCRKCEEFGEGATGDCK